jgi:hypothetical protein
MRASVAVDDDYAGSGTIGSGAIFNQLISDSSGGDAVAGGVYGYGMLYDSGAGETRVFFRGSNNSSSFVAVAGTPTLDIVVTKTNGGNPAGRGDDSMLLEVYLNNVLQGSLVGTLDGGLLGDDGEYAEFGNFNGSPSGTFALEWATFGIGELAPIIVDPIVLVVPEPSVLSLVMVSALAVVSIRPKRRALCREA